MRSLNPLNCSMAINTAIMTDASVPQSTVFPPQETHVYHHEPLPPKDPDAIRLLTLYPGLENDMVEVAFTTNTVHQAPRYTALSYVWGDQTTRDTVYIASKQDSYVSRKRLASFSVTYNLFCALKAIRSRDEPQTLWVDALCINQSDIAERNQQVLLMTRIYKSAAEVLVWLGKDDEHTELAVRATVAIASAGASLTSRKSWKSKRIDVLDIDSLHHNMDLVWPALPHPKVAYEAMCMLFRRPWFDRVWVFQELCAAKDVHVQVGPYRLLWGDLITADDVLRALGMVKGQARSCERALQMDMWRASIYGGTEPDVLELLEFLQISQSTDPRDKVFAMLGLVSPQSFSITPDYNASVAQVYQDVVIECIRKSGYLDIIGNAWLNPFSKAIELPYWLTTLKDPALPSWAVDWRTRSLGTNLWRFIKEKKFDATTGSKADFIEKRGLNILCLKGVVCDTVASVSAEPLLPTEGEVNNGNVKGSTDSAEMSKRSVLAQSTLHSWTQFVHQYLGCSLYAPTGETITDATWMTMIAGGLITGRPITMQYRLEARIWVEKSMALINGSDNSGRKRLSEATTGYYNLNRLKPPALWPHMTDFPVYAATTSTFKRIFSTNGNYVGTGPVSMQQGDLICLLLGGRTPFLLRPENGHYLLVGECYVHGMMNGERMKGFRDSDIQELEIW